MFRFDRPLFRSEHDILSSGSCLCSTELIRCSFGGGQPNINAEVLRAFRVPLPPISEQIAIVSYLDKTSSKIDKAITQAQCEIELLHEYRTRLVADVVTGKLDVREAAAQLPDEAPLELVEDDTGLADEFETADEMVAL